jgi:hypothetical protein
MTSPTRLSVAEAARLLAVDIEAVLDLVYRGVLQGRPDRRTGRVLIETEALDRYREAST